MLQQLSQEAHLHRAAIWVVGILSLEELLDELLVHGCKR